MRCLIPLIPQHAHHYALYAMFFVVIFLVLFLVVVPTKNASADTHTTWCGDVKTIQPTSIESIFTKKNDLTLQVSGYPQFGDGPSLNDIAGDLNNNKNDEGSRNISSLVSYFYNAVLVLSAIIAFLSVLYTGIMYSLSGASPELRKTALTRLKKVFIGIAIVLFSVLILNEINPSLTNTGTFDLIEKHEETPEPTSVPRGGKNRDIRRDFDNSIQRGLPFSSSQSTEPDYANIATPLSSKLSGKDKNENKCRMCNEEDNNKGNFICSPFCYNRNLSDYEDKNTQLRDQYMVIGLDRLKCKLDADADVGEDYTTWALVKDDDNPIVSCVAACAVIKEKTEPGTITDILLRNREGKEDANCAQYNVGSNIEAAQEGIEKIQEAVNKALGKDDDSDTYKNWNPKALNFKNHENNKEYIEDDGQWYDGKIEGFKNGYIFWDNTNSAGRNSLKLHDSTFGGSTVNRSPLRQCISEHLLYDAQEWPRDIVGNTDVNICLCR